MAACCVKDQIFTDPCQAITDGVLTERNYIAYGITPSGYANLIATCNISVGGAVQTVEFGSQIAPPTAGPYSSWLVVNTGAVSFKVNGITLNAAGSSTNASATNGDTIPNPVFSTPGAETYEWRTIK